MSRNHDARRRETMRRRFVAFTSTKRWIERTQKRLGRFVNIFRFATTSWLNNCFPSWPGEALRDNTVPRLLRIYLSPFTKDSRWLGNTMCLHQFLEPHFSSNNKSTFAYQQNRQTLAMFGRIQKGQESRFCPPSNQQRTEATARKLVHRWDQQVHIQQKWNRQHPEVRTSGRVRSVRSCEQKKKRYARADNAAKYNRGPSHVSGKQ